RRADGPVDAAARRARGDGPDHPGAPERARAGADGPSPRHGRAPGPGRRGARGGREGHQLRRPRRAGPSRRGRLTVADSVRSAACPETAVLDRADLADRDTADPLAPLRARWDVPDDL